MSDSDRLEQTIADLRKALDEQQRKHQYDNDLWEARLRYATRGMEVSNRELSKESSALARANSELERANSELESKNQELGSLRQSLEAQNVELQRAIAAAKAASHAKDQFLANVSHELRTPLTLLLAPLQSTLDERAHLPDNIYRQLSLAARNGRRLLRQINMLLDFTKGEAGHMVLEVAAHDPVAVARELIEEAEPAARARELTLHLQAPAHTSLVEFDRERVDQALLNLVGNAIKFTPRGGRIELGVQFVDGAVIFVVRDTGIGIPAAELPHIFESFRQVHRHRHQAEPHAIYRREHQGTGLGLALVKHIAQLHRGTIEVFSREGKGTVFCLRLPQAHAGLPMPTGSQHALEPPATHARRAGLAVDLADFEVEPVSAAEEPRVESAPAGQRKPRILVVDDEPDVRRYLGELLRSSYEVLYAVDGQHGIDRALADQPDLIISDVMMPRKSGLELVHELKHMPATRVIPILLLTARGGVRGTVTGLLRGADDYVAKPFDPKELLARTYALLRITQLERELASINRYLESELDAAQTIQQALMPTGQTLALSGVEIAGLMQPAYKLGGDFFDYFPLQSARGRECLGVSIGDVTGHGASSALLTGVTKAALEAHAAARQSPHELLTLLNRVIVDSCKGLKAVTFFYGVLDLQSRRLLFSNAGHNFPFIYHTLARRGSTLCMAGEPLGYRRDASYHAREAQLQAGDIVILYSDGIVEATRGRRMYGLRRLMHRVAELAHMPASHIATSIVADALHYSGRPHPEDDMTIVVMKIA